MFMAIETNEPLFCYFIEKFKNVWNKNSTMAAWTERWLILIYYYEYQWFNGQAVIIVASRSKVRGFDSRLIHGTDDLSRGDLREVEELEVGEMIQAVDSLSHCFVLFFLN